MPYSSCKRQQHIYSNRARLKDQHTTNYFSFRVLMSAGAVCSCRYALRLLDSGVVEMLGRKTFEGTPRSVSYVHSICVLGAYQQLLASVSTASIKAPHPPLNVYQEPMYPAPNLQKGQDS